MNPVGPQTLNLNRYNLALEHGSATHDIGKITQVTGFLLKGYIPGVSLGSFCQVFPVGGQPPFLVEVVGFQDRQVLFMPLGEMHGVGLGSKVVLVQPRSTIGLGAGLLGRVIDGLGQPLDSLGEFESEEEQTLYGEAPRPMDRKLIEEPLSFGVRAIDGLLTIGQGQRMAVLAGSGVGKSVLMGMISRGSSADINVIALIGERGREVKEFIARNLGEEGLKKSVVVVATSDQSPLVRLRASFAAARIAGYFANQGRQVLLMMDSITRLAMAQREIGLNVGEPPTTKGYTPSVFSLLPKLLEQAGSFDHGGSVTGLYTVLVESDDMDDPIGDAVRSITDGHIVLSRKLAHRGHFPAIDVLQSTSRVMDSVISREHRQLAQVIRENLAVFREAEDLISIGAYKKGANARLDQAVQMQPAIEAFLRQAHDDPTEWGQTYDLMLQMQQYSQT